MQFFRDKSIKKDLLKICFIICAITVTFMFNAIGANVPNMKYDSKIMSIANLTRGDQITQININKIDDKESVKWSDAKSVVSYFYQYKDRYRPYCKVDKTFSLTSDGNIEHDVSICSLGFYNDTKYTEYLHLPLHLTEEPMMRKGPRFNANFASYIPSSIADFLLEKLGLASYNQLLQKDYKFYINFEDGNTYSFSINNIYLNSTTQNWINKVNDDFYKFFGKWNPNAILISSSDILDNIAKTKLCFDTNSGYGNIDKITRKCNTTLGDNIEYNIVRRDGKSYILSVRTDDFRSGFFAKSQIPFFIVAILIIFFQSVLVLYSNNLKKNLLKNTILISIIYLLMGTIIEIIKSRSSFNVSAFYYIFNYIGAVFTLIYIFGLIIAYLILSIRADNKNDKKNV